MFRPSENHNGAFQTATLHLYKQITRFRDYLRLFTTSLMIYGISDRTFFWSCFVFYKSQAHYPETLCDPRPSL